MTQTVFAPVRIVLHRSQKSQCAEASIIALPNRGQPKTTYQNTDQSFPARRRLCQNIIAHEHANAVPGPAESIRNRNLTSIPNREALRSPD